MPSIGGVMALGVVLGVIALIVLVLFGFEAAWSVRQAVRRPTATADALRRHDRAAGSLGRAAAIAATIGSAEILAVIGMPDGLQQGLPLCIGAGVGLVVLIVVEQRWPAPGGTIRTADVQPRRLADVLPRAGMWIAGIAVLLAVASSVVYGVLASSTGGRPGSVTAAAAWPDWRWSVPQLVGLVVVLLVAAVAVVQLLHRPALAGFDRTVDLTFRRCGVDRALRVVAVVGFCQVAAGLNAIKNAGFAAGVSYDLIKTVVWLSTAAVVAALISIPAFRTHPPKKIGSARPVAAAVPR